MPDNFVDINLIVTPVLTFSGIKKSYRLPDMSYGLFLIYEKDRPRYFLDAFDNDYEPFLRDAKAKHEPIIDFIALKLKNADGNLTIEKVIRGIRLGNETSTEIFRLEKFPVSFFL